MHSQKNYNIYTFESASEKNKRFRSIVVTQFISFSYNMLSFYVNKEKIKDLMIYLGKYYDIEEGQMEEIFKNLEEYSYINESKVKENFNQGESERISSENNNYLSLSQESSVSDPNAKSTENQNKIETNGSNNLKIKHNEDAKTYKSNK